MIIYAALCYIADLDTRLMSKKHSRVFYLYLIFLISFILASGSSTALAQGQDKGPGKRLGFRLRSFIPKASASIYFEPTLSGGEVRLTALGLPEPESLMPDAQMFLVWAVASGEDPRHVGTLQPDGGGNGGLSFARPASFERYSIVVTAETSADAKRPAGVMVFASRADAVTAFYGEKNSKLTAARRKALDRELGKRERGVSNDFYQEVEAALKASTGGGRTIELLGDEIAPEATGLALVAASNENIYVRTLIKKLPLPSHFGANTYVLWGMMPDGRIAYMGSLPADVNDADTYLRIGGFSSADLDLLVTAEVKRPVAGPSGLRAVSSRIQRPESGPAYGAIEGRVLDAESNPLAGAMVDLHPIEETVIAGSLPVAYTDEQGRFFLDGVIPGTHMIYASKEEAGYSSSYLGFFIDPSVVPKVTVYNKQVTEGVILRLGSKAARLAARIVDAETNQPVEDAEVILYRTENPDDYFSFGLNQSGGRFQQLIPSLPLKMKVTAPGYEDWFYGENGTQEKQSVIEVAPNTTKELLIALRQSKRGLTP